MMYYKMIYINLKFVYIVKGYIGFFGLVGVIGFFGLLG